MRLLVLRACSKIPPDFSGTPRLGPPASEALLLSSLRLPTLDTPTQTLRDTEVQLGYDGRITMGSDGTAFDQLVGWLSDCSPAAPHGPSDLLLRELPP